MIQYVFEDSDSSTLSIFFKSLYSSEELSRIHFVGSNKNLFKKASDIVEHCTDDYIVVYLDMVPGIPIEVSIYNRLRSLSLRNDARIAVMPITCFEYFTIKSLRLVGVHEKYKQSIDLCLRRERFDQAYILSIPRVRKKCTNFEKYCKQVLSTSFLECVDTESILGKTSVIGRKYFESDCICVDNDITHNYCKECKVSHKVIAFLRQFPVVPKVGQLGSRYSAELDDGALWKMHRKQVDEFNYFQNKFYSDAGYIQEIEYIK